MKSHIRPLAYGAWARVDTGIGTGLEIRLQRAGHILDNWEAYLPKFVKVMPVEYRKALEAMSRHQTADSTGFDVLEIGLKQASGA